jgi:hypothetical protein
MWYSTDRDNQDQKHDDEFNLQPNFFKKKAPIVIMIYLEMQTTRTLSKLTNIL